MLSRICRTNRKMPARLFYGLRAKCDSPEHCACIDDDYEKIEGGTGCKPKMNRNLCVDKDLADQNRWITFRSNNQGVPPMVCCDGYERLNESKTCLRKVDEHECTELIQVWDKQTLAPNGVSRITTTQLQRVCCEGYKRQTTNEPCLPQSEVSNIIEHVLQYVSVNLSIKVTDGASRNLKAHVRIPIHLQKMAQKTSHKNT
ncbi:uncharacterized protein LOC116803814 [Drosophila mojavensis]|uniref:uncharacterized protein LOC116803814 n=1 Tax=Drosophila mojavensis TaxID=7230 RepID=UPI0013EEE870|nr:uncharacterized protein LOC116803814 [Drosophila mojavensis]